MNDTNRTARVGLGALLTPDNCVLVLMDHQPFQFTALGSHDSQAVKNNVVGLAKVAKNFGVPTLLTTVVEGRGGRIIPGLQAVFPDQVPIERTTLNTWEDERVIQWVEATGRKKVVMAVLWTEICLALPAIHALGEGYDVFIVTDASGGVSPESHEQAVRRMVQAGAVPITWIAVSGELQRDWARLATLQHYTELLEEHTGAIGTSLAWEAQLLATPVEPAAEDRALAAR